MALTDRVIRNAKPRNTVYRLRDGNSTAKGFGVTIAPAGSKTFFLGYTSPSTGKRTQINLGRFPETSLKEAREKARFYRGHLTDGVDPKEGGKTSQIPEGQVPEGQVTKVDLQTDVTLEPSPIEPEIDFAVRVSAAPSLTNAHPFVNTGPPIETAPSIEPTPSVNTGPSSAGAPSFSIAQSINEGPYDNISEGPARTSADESGYVTNLSNGSNYSDPERDAQSQNRSIGNEKFEFGIPQGRRPKETAHNLDRFSNTAIDQTSYPRPVYSRDSMPQTVADKAEIDIADLFHKLWHKKGLVFATILVCMAATITVVFQITPSFYSEALVLIDPKTNKIVDVESVVSGLSGDSESIQSEIQIILSRDLARQVIVSLNLDSNPEFNTSLAQKGFLKSLIGQFSDISKSIPDEWKNAIFGKNTNQNSSTLPDSTPAQDHSRLTHTNELAIKGGTSTLNTFIRKLTVKPKGRSRVISIGTTSINAKLTARISNTLAKLYLKQMIDQKVDATRQASSWLDERIIVLQGQVAKAESAVEKYRSESGLLEAGGSTVSSLQVAELSTQLIIAVRRHINWNT